MDAYMNKEKQFTEDQQAEKSALEYAKEQERVNRAQNYIYLLSDSSSSLSSYYSLETSLDDSSDSGTRQKPT